MGKLLTKEDILQVQDLPTERVVIEEWGGEVLVRGLTAAERDAFEQSITERRGDTIIPKLDNIRAKLVARCVINEDGSRMFDDADIEALGRKSAAALDRIFSVAQKLSGMRPEDLEQMAKN